MGRTKSIPSILKKPVKVAKPAKPAKKVKYAWGRQLLKESELCFLLPKDKNLSIHENDVDNDIYRAQNGYWFGEKMIEGNRALGDANDLDFVYFLENDKMTPYSLSELKETAPDRQVEDIYFPLDIDGVPTGNAIKADGSIIRNIENNEPIDL
jgi:hypothetical protein